MTGMERDAILAGFTLRTLAHADWDHEAHLTICWYTVRHLGPAGALAYLRREIPAFNGSIGIENTPTSGYHETLTRYFVDAVADADADEPSTLFVDPTCTRDAPLRHWSRERLFSTEARAAWCAPDLEPLTAASEPARAR